MPLTVIASVIASKRQMKECFMFDFVHLPKCLATKISILELYSKFVLMSFKNRILKNAPERGKREIEFIFLIRDINGWHYYIFISDQ